MDSELQRIAKRCRHERLGYDDGQPGTVEDIRLRLEEAERCLRSWSRAVNNLMAKLNG